MVALSCLAGVLLPGAANARTEGPYRGQVIDGETGAPLAGVVVVAYYEKKSPSWVHYETEFYDLDETVTDVEGRFSLAPRTLPISTPLSHVVGPIFIFFKGGYKGWRFKGVDYGELADPAINNERHEEAWRKFSNGEPVVIVKARAKTRNERSLEMGNAQPHILTEGPGEGRARRLQQALEEEQIAVRNLR